MGELGTDCAMSMQSGLADALDTIAGELGADGVRALFEHSAAESGGGAHEVPSQAVARMQRLLDAWAGERGAGSASEATSFAGESFYD